MSLPLHMPGVHRKEFFSGVPWRTVEHCCSCSWLSSHLSKFAWTTKCTIKVSSGLFKEEMHREISSNTIC
jgi:hypothetical protein